MIGLALLIAAIGGCGGSSSSAGGKDAAPAVDTASAGDTAPAVDTAPVVDTAPTPDVAPPAVDAGRDATTRPDAGRDGPAPDGGPAGLAAHRGTSVMAGAVQAKSSRFRVIMSIGQSPGGNGTAATSTYKARGGLVGATQGR
jgi:hypothetical protein